MMGRPDCVSTPAVGRGEGGGGVHGGLIWWDNMLASGEGRQRANGGGAEVAVGVGGNWWGSG
jgi:hypothetical protein